MKVCFVGNEARAMCMWWAPLLRMAQKAGHEVICCVPQNDVVKSDSCENERIRKHLAGMCARVRFFPLERRGVHPWQEWQSLWSLFRLLRQEKPDIIFAYTVKPVVYAGLVCRYFLRKTHFFACITGLGAVFERKTPLQACVRWLYRSALKGATKVFFQNKDDRNFFAHSRLFTGDAVLCRGTGVDTAHFAFEPNFPPCPTFILVGRLLLSKGILEFVEAARCLRQKYPHARFQLLGRQEDGGIDMESVRAWHSSGIIEYLGHVEDVRSFLRDATVVVLPSWREGTPCAVLEGMSMGRAAVVTDVPGCQEVVRHGVNGFVVPFMAQGGVRGACVQALTDALECFLVDMDLAQRMGAEGRRMTEEIFDAQKVATMLAGHMHLL